MKLLEKYAGAKLPLERLSSEGPLTGEIDILGVSFGSNGEINVRKYIHAFEELSGQIILEDKEGVAAVFYPEEDSIGAIPDSFFLFDRTQPVLLKECFVNFSDIIYLADIISQLWSIALTKNLEQKDRILQSLERVQSEDIMEKLHLDLQGAEKGIQLFSSAWTKDQIEWYN